MYVRLPKYSESKFGPHFIEKYCSTELREYRRIFRATDEVSPLTLVRVGEI